MDIVIFSTINWDNMDGARRPARIARELICRGHHVMYVEAQPSVRRPAVQGLTVVALAELGIGEQEFRRAWLGVYPGELQPFVDNFSTRLDAFEGERKGPRIAMWCDPFVPLILPLPQLRERGYYALYDCRDDFEAFAKLGYYFGSKAAERYLLQECDLVSVVSTNLLGKFKTLELNAYVRLLRQGIDLTEFRISAPPTLPPEDLARGDRTLGFWGLVNDFNVDPDLLGHLARTHPTWTINLIGPVDSDPQRAPVAERLRPFPNIYLLGEKPHAQLAEYLYWFDLALIPFPPNAFNRNRDPIKVFEYLAGYKPVVTTNTPQLAGMPYVYLAETAESFLAAVELAMGKPVDHSELDAYLDGCTWSARVDTLLAWIEEQPRHSESLPALSTKQFYPSLDLPANLSAYVTQTERLLAERTAYIEHMEVEWQRTRQYLLRIERTHPLIWLKRLVRHG